MNEIVERCYAIAVWGGLLLVVAAIAMLFL
jgi:hypothetical protein